MINEKGDYLVNNIDEKVFFTNKTIFRIHSVDIFNSDYEMEVENIIDTGITSPPNDTFFYKCDKAKESERLNEFIDVFNQLVDTLIENRKKVVTDTI